MSKLISIPVLNKHPFDAGTGKKCSVFFFIFISESIKYFIKFCRENQIKQGWWDAIFKRITREGLTEKKVCLWVKS